MEHIRKQWLDGNSFSRQEEVTFADCDPNGMIRPSVLLKFCVTAAGNDFAARGFSYNVLRQEHHAVMLLSRIVLQIHRCPQANDLITVSTWEDGVHAAHFRRAFELTALSGERLVSARSEWILADPDNHRILRPASFTGKTMTVCSHDIYCPECQRIKLPPDRAAALGTRKIRWSDLDGNGHLFSGHYGDIIWDSLPDSLQNTVPHTLYLNYNKEATLGQTLQLSGFQEQNVYWMHAVGPAGVCFTSKCEF